MLVTLLTHLPATGGDGQTCYLWYRWLLSNQCCQGTKIKDKAAEMLQ